MLNIIAEHREKEKRDFAGIRPIVTEDVHYSYIVNMLMLLRKSFFTDLEECGMLT